ncbi:MAG: response regulator transcription factor [Cryobacterium sp.]|nr:response regulator transcription factor [Oligoflexia bacterium]
MEPILIVEDDPKIATTLMNLFRGEGWTIQIADSTAALNDVILSRGSDFSVILLDRLLQQFDTKALLPEMRKRWSQTPILVLSAINTPLERAELLNLGVDDYLGKPFLNQELLARVRALSRRAKRPEEVYRQLGNTLLDLNRFSFSVEGREESLPQKEFLILRLLSRDLGRVFGRDDLMSRVWGEATSSESNVVEATITHLRRRLEVSGSSIKLKNLRNVGYFVEI